MTGPAGGAGPPDWLDRYADALGVPRAGGADREALLDLARVVAHGTERKGAPIATFLAGLAAGVGISPGDALARADRLLDGRTT